MIFNASVKIKTKKKRENNLLTKHTLFNIVKPLYIKSSKSAKCMHFNNKIFYA